MSEAPFTGFSRRPMSQRRDEIEPFARLLASHGVRAYLEIGAREGDTFHYVMSALKPGSRGLAIDLPGAKWGKANSAHLLARACRDLSAKGYNVRALIGDSKDARIIAEALRGAPYGAVFIDADHTYAAVLADWLNYGGMAPLVAFHDIDGYGMHTKDGTPVQVPDLWGDLQTRYQSLAIVGKVRGMGIGVLYVNEPLAKQEQPRCLVLPR